MRCMHGSLVDKKEGGVEVVVEIVEIRERA
jgi:hypothetical protein